MKAKEYLENVKVLEKARAEAQPPEFKSKDSPTFTCKVDASGGVRINGICPASDALALAEWIAETYSE